METEVARLQGWERKYVEGERTRADAEAKLAQAQKAFHEAAQQAAKSHELNLKCHNLGEVLQRKETLMLEQRQEWARESRELQQQLEKLKAQVDAQKQKAGTEAEERKALQAKLAQLTKESDGVHKLRQEKAAVESAALKLEVEHKRQLAAMEARLKEAEAERVRYCRCCSANGSRRD
jgi:chromosome segregation ATPase